MNAEARKTAHADTRTEMPLPPEFKEAFAALFEQQAKALEERFKAFEDRFMPAA